MSFAVFAEISAAIVDVVLIDVVFKCAVMVIIVFMLVMGMGTGCRDAVPLRQCVPS